MKFTGEFKDLMPMGFRFHKLYARNYRVYEKDDMWLWVSQREVVFKDLIGPQLDQCVDMIVNDKFPLYDEERYLGEYLLMSIGDPKMCIIDKLTNEMLAHDEFLKKWMKEFPDPIEYTEFVHGSQRFRELCIHRRHIDLIKEMNKRNMLTWEKTWIK